MPADSGPSEHLFVRRISVEELFGRYTYDLRLPNTADSSRLLILYGDNGSGKTTLLCLVYYLLTSVEGRDYKGFVAKTPFRRLVIELGRGTELVAERRGAELVGAFRASIKRNNKTVCSLLFKVDKDNDVVPKTLGYQDQFTAFLNAVRQLRISLFFITDDRELLSNVVPSRGDEGIEIMPDEATVLHGRLWRRRRERKGIDIALEQAIRLATDSTRQRVISGTRQGEADAGTIYATIIRRLAHPSSKKDKKLPDIDTLIGLLRKQAERSAEFARFGLPSPRNIDKLAEAIKRARHSLPVISTVVQPYVDGIIARLDALQEVQQSIFAFVGTINSFYRDKTVQFDLEHGLTVTANGSHLRPTALSSGEKQLLLLFCNAMVAKDEATVVLIDEPEMSLNIKWQRQLIPCLLETSKKRNVQFILATHSFELLAPYKSHVVQLVDAEAAAKHGPAASNASGTSSHLQA
ncbi:MAG: AAA family ATPase [Terriglobales bacterium]